MDGFSYLPAERPLHTPAHTPVRSSASSIQQHTVAAPIGCVGVGLHTGVPVSVRLAPAPVGHGIQFHRTDLDCRIPARFDSVVETRLSTVIGLPGRPDARVGTIEHLMAALTAASVDNALIELDGAEVPILDGSAEPWLFLLDCAGLVAQSAVRSLIEVLRPVRVEDGDAFAELRPNPGTSTLDMAMAIDFDASAIGRQALSCTFHPDSFRRDLARARTFAQAHEIAVLREAGLARGGSLENAVVVDGDTVLNPAGLRFADEFVRHKLLDAVGDLALAGAPLQARFAAGKSGHTLNNRLLRALFAHQANWRPAQTDMLLAA